MVFLDHALHFFSGHIHVERCSATTAPRTKRFAFRDACQAAGIRHTRTRPRHPWTNGRVERFNGTIQRECLYSQQFHSEEERDLVVALFVAYYNVERPPIALGGLALAEWSARWRVTKEDLS